MNLVNFVSDLWPFYFTGPNNKWVCESVGFYRNLPAGKAAFSDDGSLLAVVFGSCITLWDPENNQLKETLVNTVFQTDIK